MGGRRIHPPTLRFLGGHLSKFLLHQNTANAKNPAFLASAKSVLFPVLYFVIVLALNDI